MNENESTRYHRQWLWYGTWSQNQLCGLHQLVLGRACWWILSKSSQNPPQHFDGSILVQKALSAIKCCNEEIGFAIAVDVLKGSFSPTVTAKGYDKIKTFTSGRDVPANDWRTYLLQMLQMGYIEIAYNEATLCHCAWRFACNKA